MPHTTGDAAYSFKSEAGEGAEKPTSFSGSGAMASAESSGGYQNIATSL